ncbi:MAG: hypothetical protein V3S32_02905 [Acidimicrobiia bacterium]
MTSLVLLDVGKPTEVEARIDESGVWIEIDGVETALGWELKSEGLCRDGICIPVARRPGLMSDGQLNLYALADLLGRPLAHSPEEGAAYLGPAMDLFDHTLETLEAPDFTLPDLEGRPHSLSEQRGLKVLLVAWASW